MKFKHKVWILLKTKTMKTLTEKQMIAILKNKKINSCTKEQKEQVFNFAFGNEFMEKVSKGEVNKWKA